MTLMETLHILPLSGAVPAAAASPGHDAFIVHTPEAVVAGTPPRRRKSVPSRSPKRVSDDFTTSPHGIVFRLAVAAGPDAEILCREYEGVHGQPSVTSTRQRIEKRIKRRQKKEQREMLLTAAAFESLGVTDFSSSSRPKRTVKQPIPFGRFSSADDSSDTASSVGHDADSICISVLSGATTTTAHTHTPAKSRSNSKASSSSATASPVQRAGPICKASPGRSPRSIKQCASCGRKDKDTPMWRDAPDGTPLCNACGIRYKKYHIRCDECHYIPRKDEKNLSHCPKCSCPTLLSD